MSDSVKVHTVNNVTLRDTAGLRRETERERVGEMKLAFYGPSALLAEASVGLTTIKIRL